jgi:hypothetical protein
MISRKRHYYKRHTSAKTTAVTVPINLAVTPLSKAQFI